MSSVRAVYLPEILEVIINLKCIHACSKHRVATLNNEQTNQIKVILTLN